MPCRSSWICEPHLTSPVTHSFSFPPLPTLPQFQLSCFMIIPALSRWGCDHTLRSSVQNMYEGINDPKDHPVHTDEQFSRPSGETLFGQSFCILTLHSLTFGHTSNLTGFKVRHTYLLCRILVAWLWFGLKERKGRGRDCLFFIMLILLC